MTCLLHCYHDEGQTLARIPLRRSVFCRGPLEFETQSVDRWRCCKCFRTFFTWVGSHPSDRDVRLPDAEEIL